MDHASSAATDTKEREITTTRTFRAPRELVWRMWTEPELIARWWGPKGFSITTRAMEVRPGGRWDFTMHGPDGTDYKNEVVYVEVRAPEHLVYDHVAPPFRVTATLVAQGDETQVTMRMVFPTAELRDRTVKVYNAVDGQKQTLNRLEEELAAIAEDPAQGPHLVLTRTFDAPRSLVFDAFVKPEILARWWGPKGFTLPTCEVDLRPGGALRFCMRGPDGQDYWMRGSFREIERPDRLLFGSYIHDDSKQEIVTTLTFTEHEGKTTLTVRQTVPFLEGPARGQKQGWTESLERLAATVERR
jgi:uncharacterized protein YndB with AHSA1/START domain